MTSVRTTAFILWIGLLAAAPAASRPEWWQADSYDEFAEGRVNGLAVTFDGRLVLAPEFRQLADSGQPYILCAAAAEGRVYFGTGHEGKVFQLDAQGKITEILDTEEPDIFALAVGTDGTLYAGAGPGGKVYRIGRDGRSSVLADLKCRYIWALLPARDGSLFVATGVEGRIYRIRGEEPEEFYDSSQTHILCLAYDLAGNLLAGTAPNGYVLRVGADGKGTSLFDAPHAEVHQLQTDRYGRVYVLGVGRETDETAPAGEGAADGGALIFQKDEPRKKNRSKADAVAADIVVTAGSTSQDAAGLYRLEKDSSIRTLWTSAQFKAFALHVGADNTVLMGTGDRGRILSLRDDRVMAVLAESGQEQLTVLIGDQSGVLAFSSNLGKVYRLGAEPGASGEYISDVIDAEGAARFGALQAIPSALPAGMSLELFFRSGNTASPDEAWTEWSGPLAASGGAAAATARYGQIKAVLRRGPSAAEGSAYGVEALQLAYQQQNQPPALLTLTLNPPGVLYQKQPVMPMPGEPPDYGEHSTLALPDHIQAGLTKMLGTMQQPKVFRAGTLSLSWTDRDPNNDTLEYSVHVRSVGAPSWTRLAEGLRQNWFNINRDVLSDGKYLFKVVATDAPSNPPDQAREDFRISRVVTLDAAPPRLRAQDVRVTEGGWVGTIEVADDLSPVYRVESSRDGGVTWSVLPSEDGLCDQLQERCRLAVPGLAPDVHVLLVRAMDYSGNLAVVSVSTPH